jgi:low affinity Fe/Cu permease
VKLGLTDAGKNVRRRGGLVRRCWEITVLVQVLRRIALTIPEIVGSPLAFLAAVVLVVGWLVWGVFAHWGTSWLLWPSAIASVVTFLIVFSLQYTQNRDTRAVQIKLDEILRTSDHARTDLVKLERRSDEELTVIEQEILDLRDRSEGGELS